MEVTGILVVGGAATAVAGWMLDWWALVPAALTVALLSFYRDPPRKTPAGGNLVIAPADGLIVDISKLPAAGEDPPMLSITIFLSVLNVHLNRSPCSGQVTIVKYKPGKFINAMDPNANIVNEANLIGFSPQAPLVGPIYIRQIAGLLAKRIVCAVNVGDAVTAGQRVGMIKLGSRTELRVPDDDGWKVLVRVGDRVRGAKTPMLARRLEDLGSPAGRTAAKLEKEAHASRPLESH